MSDNRTLIRLSVPVLFSLIAEPLTGLVDTAFVARLGSESLSGLGAGAIALSSIFWIFNFLGIGTQTEVAKGDGAGQTDHVRKIATLAIAVGGALGLAVILIGLPSAGLVSRAMGAEGAVEAASTSYIRIRLLGAPAMLTLLGIFGTMRGRHDMKSPLWIAVGVNMLNVGLDWLLIFGAGPIPAFGIEGAAAASSASQWVGALAGVAILNRQVGLGGRIRGADVRALFKVGGDIFVRTGMLTLFLILGTRAATRLGAESGAAHQAIRQAWLFTALFLDAWAVSAQTMVGNAVGAMDVARARRIAALACWWSLGTGAVLTLSLLAATGTIQAALVPPGAVSLFQDAWWVAIVMLPLSGLTFATDGIHWGTGDFVYLRNATIVATLVSGGVLVVLESGGLLSLAGIWWLTAAWVGVRAVFGLIRVWPGIGQAPLRG
ncbi:MAG: MATE family multidrug resistance protein [Rhodothermales bacterium]|jgi:MATE family multidrug resistance protein